MRSTFADSDFEDADFEEPLDTQLTLGTGSILGIFFGLVMICGMFFGFGYSLGRRNLSQAAVKAPTAPPQMKTTIASAASPAPAIHLTPALQVATPQQPAMKTAPLTSAPASASLTPSAASPIIRTVATGGTAPTINTSPNPVAALHIPKPSAIHPVLVQPRAGIPYVPGVAMPPNPYEPASNWVWTPPFDVHPNNRRSVAFHPRQTTISMSHTAMVVQIAALSREDDAEVLASALRKVGFIPTIHSDAQDTLYHVQLGPYDRNVAMAARQRLIARGYNAILK
jgi:cell division septation protein DedD